MGSLKLIGEQEGGSDDHAALANLDFASAGHSGFVTSDGIAGGQTLIGGVAPSEHLTLQSTVHATRGYLRAQDDLQLLSDILRDSGGNERITLAPASPHITATGRMHITERLGVATPPAAESFLKATADVGAGTGSDYAIWVEMAAASPNFFGTVVGLFGFARNKGSGTLSTVRGLEFRAIIDPAATGPSLLCYGALIKVETPASGPSSIAQVSGLLVTAAQGMAPTTALGIEVTNFGVSGGATVYGLKIADQTGPTNSYIIEAGPATPYLRLVGGANPGAYLTNLYLNEGGNLRRVQVKDGASIGAGDRVMVLV